MTLYEGHKITLILQAGNLTEFKLKEVRIWPKVQQWVCWSKAWGQGELKYKDQRQTRCKDIKGKGRKQKRGSEEGTKHAD